MSPKNKYYKEFLKVYFLGLPPETNKTGHQRSKRKRKKNHDLNKNSLESLL